MRIILMQTGDRAMRGRNQSAVLWLYGEMLSSPKHGSTSAMACSISIGFGKLSFKKKFLVAFLR